MTLSTEVYVKDRIDRRELFVKCNQIIGAHEGIEFTETDDSIWNELGQGLCAALDVKAFTDGRPVCDGTEPHSRWCDGDADHEDMSSDYDCRDEPCFALVDFDTAYSYNFNGERCGDLHARLVAELGKWLDDKAIDWSWRNEFTSEVHHRYEGLTALCESGGKASDWFRDIAAPAIAAHIASGGNS